MAGRFRVGEWTVVPELNSLGRGQRTVHLEPKVMQVLVTLGAHAGEVLSKEFIFHHVWAGTFVSDEVLTRAISELRKVFEDDPRQPKYIQTIPKGGYRLVASVVAQATDRAESLPVRWNQKGLQLGTLGALAVLAAVTSLYFLRSKPRAVSMPRITSLAVLPLINLSGDAGQDYFAEGMTDELTTRLSKIGALRVISRTSAMHYKGTQKTIPDIARELNVDAVLEGSVLRSGDKVRISAQLIQARTDKHLWAESYERDLRDILALQSDVARTIAKEIRIQVTPQEERKLAANLAVDPQAHDSYLRGLYFWNKFTEEGMRRAVDDFEDAIRKQPDYAPAYAGLAHAYHELAYYVAPKEVMPRAKQAAMRALELDDTDAEAHAALGWIKWHYDWDWSGPEQEYIRAIEVNPSSSMARAQYAIYLDTLGRAQEGLQQHNLVLELNPLSLVDRTILGDAYDGAGRYDEAIGEYQQVLELDPNFAIAHEGLGTTYVEQGKFREGIQHLQKATQLDTDLSFSATLAYALAVSGNKSEARKILAGLVDSSQKRYTSGVSVAVGYMGMGNQDQACVWLERAYQERDGYLWEIKLEPAFAQLRSNACFHSILARIGLGN